MDEASGSYGESGASKAMSTRTLKMTTPAIAPGCLRKRFQTMEDMLTSADVMFRLFARLDESVISVML
jgi:hypothetical protein